MRLDFGRRRAGGGGEGQREHQRPRAHSRSYSAWSEVGQVGLSTSSSGSMLRGSATVSYDGEGS